MSLAVDRIAAHSTGAQVIRPTRLVSLQPRVSVIIPCYNLAHYLPRCIESVISQPGVEVDVLVVDDASSDGSGDVAAEMAAADARIRVLRHRRNTGHITTYNDGLTEAAGDYVVLLSADDLLTPGSLERATALLETYSGVGFAYGAILTFTDGHLPKASTRVRSWAVWPGRDWLQRRFFTSRNVIRSCEVVMRSAIQREIGGYRPELPHAADLDMWIRAAAVADVGFVSGAHQAYYRLHPANMHAMMHQGREVSGVLRDLQERARTFDLVAKEVADTATARAAQRALAVEALTYAKRAYTFGIVEHAVADGFVELSRAVVQRSRPIATAYTPIEELVHFALQTYPDAPELVQWQAVEKSQSVAGRRSPLHNPLYLGREAIQRVAGKMRHWPWHRLGG